MTFRDAADDVGWLGRAQARGGPGAVRHEFPTGDIDEVLGDIEHRPHACAGSQDILLGGYGMSARDTLHLAEMDDADITRVMSFDAGFDSYPGIERLD